MASIARRWQDLDTEITRLEAVLEQLSRGSPRRSTSR